MRFEITEKTICEAINLGWRVAQNTPADNISDNIRRWVNVSHELRGMLALINWSAATKEEIKTEEIKTFHELAEDIVYLLEFANFMAYEY